MIVSTKGRYALRVIIDLAEHQDGNYIPMKDVAARQGISLGYLAQIMPLLSKAGMIDGVAGKGGGYRLNRSPKQYRVGDILRLTEGNMAPVSCMEEGAMPCRFAGECRTLPLWRHVGKMLYDYFDSVSIADLMIQ